MYSAFWNVILSADAETSLANKIGAGGQQPECLVPELLVTFRPEEFPNRMLSEVSQDEFSAIVVATRDDFSRVKDV
jgi:hypothetical protein